MPAASVGNPRGGADGRVASVRPVSGARMPVASVGNPSLGRR
jgi:hypothetical protein